MERMALDMAKMKPTVLIIVTFVLWLTGAIPFGEAWIAFLLILAFGEKM